MASRTLLMRGPVHQDPKNAAGATTSQQPQTYGSKIMGTANDEINKIITKYGNNTEGLSILARALARASGEQTAYIMIGEKVASETPKYKELQARERRALARIKKGIDSEV